MKLITLAASIALTLACQQNQIASQTEGHFEEFTQEQLESHENKQTVVAEHAANSSIVLSLNAITNFGKEALFASILEAGAEKIYVTVPKNYGSSFGPSQNLDTIKDQGEDFAKLRSVIGSEIEKVELIEQVEEGYLTVWARDWAPLGALDEEGNPVLVDINYYPHRVGDDSTARSMGKIESFNRISLPVYNEGGNFMSNTRNECLMTSRVVDANAIKAIPGDIILNSDRIKEYYTKYAGCEKVHIFQRMPYEGTGHIDMWAKFLDDDTILLSELRDEAIDVLAIDSSDRAAAKEIQAYLKEMRLEVESLGYNVVTIPMPTPMVSQWHTRSYTNSLIVGDTAIVPRYLVQDLLQGTKPYPDHLAINAYEAEVTKVYESLGYKVDWVEADDLISMNGAIHCITMQLPF